MKGFRAFVKTLATNTARLNNVEQLGDVTLVLGNESADLDSMVSSISLAYALSSEQEKSNITAAIPVINTNRSDMALRPECGLLLRTTLAAEGGRLEDLTFIDDFDLSAVVRRYAESQAHGQLDVWLADHNAPASRQTPLEPFVRGIVDHHTDEGRCPDAWWRQIEPVGSCTTLVAAKLRALAIAASSSDLISAPLAKMLLAPILLDTSNMNPAASRATDKDIEYASWLVPQVQWAWPSTSTTTVNWQNENSDSDQLSLSLNVHSTDELYRTLDKLKGDVSHLSSYDLLRKDYKQWDVKDAGGNNWTVGISSISYRLRKWLKRDGRDNIEDAVAKWVEYQNLDLALVMTHGKAKEEKGGPKIYGRDLTVVFSSTSTTPESRRMVLAGLLAADSLELRSYFNSDAATDAFIHFYSQTRTTSSRKQVFPAIKSVIEAVSV
ncbi:DHH phosphoesterase [Coemansia reversa NRRL 1564]|uniref:DHH phosphoesterase n=1 Tax=Coemansia reversa (strain ATCC 12441 / NRRL 1564) TaxID=763665 RepID=A0A2G5BE49_COERN|nr:DHH phosphoesterase [Coemansia reversa NRRL 1564]|eukprot:PIA17285.1 DHH phosphoesterase [Coemansia reversa NRRL 1564]